MKTLRILVLAALTTLTLSNCVSKPNYDDNYNFYDLRHSEIKDHYEEDLMKRADLMEYRNDSLGVHFYFDRVLQDPIRDFIINCDVRGIDITDRLKDLRYITYDYIPPTRNEVTGEFGFFAGITFHHPLQDDFIAINSHGFDSFEAYLTTIHELAHLVRDDAYHCDNESDPTCSLIMAATSRPRDIMFIRFNWPQEQEKFYNELKVFMNGKKDNKIQSNELRAGKPENDPSSIRCSR